MKEVKENLRSLLDERPEYRPIIMKILSYEEEIPEDKDYRGWEWSDVSVQGSRLSYLATQGILDVTYNSGKHTDYLLKDKGATREVLEEIVQAERATKVKPAREEGIPDDLFSPIAGFEDLKWLFKKSIEGVRDHILLVGPPSTAKTLFLLELGRLPNASYVLGHSTTAPGLEDQLYDRRPRYVLIDEIARMDKEDYGALLPLMETGRLQETKSGKNRKIVLGSNVYAACNRTEGIPPELMDRFEDLELPEYSESQFVEVSRDVLVEREGVPPSRAEYIAREVLNIGKDIRMAVRIARTCETPKEIDRRIEIISKYG